MEGQGQDRQEPERAGAVSEGQGQQERRGSSAAAGSVQEAEACGPAVSSSG